MHKTISKILLTLLPIATILMIGCSDGERVAKVATEAADRQAQQNQEMAQLNREVAEGTKRMVEADAVFVARNFRGVFNCRACSFAISRCASN